MALTHAFAHFLSNCAHCSSDGICAFPTQRLTLSVEPIYGSTERAPISEDVVHAGIFDLLANPPKRYDILMNSFTECPDQETSGRIPMLAGESP